MHKNVKGFSVVELVLILVIVSTFGLTGAYVYKVNSASHKVKSTTSAASNVPVNTPKQIYSNPRPKVVVPSPAPVDINVNDFYSCWYKVAHLSDSKPFTCSYAGKVYNAPTVFDKSQITNYDKLPQSIQSRVINDAQLVFDRCNAGPDAPYNPQVVIAQSNFVGVGLGCDSGYIQLYGYDNNQWLDLGHSQSNLTCEMVDKYQIKKSSFPSTLGEQDKCYYNNGTSKQLS